MITVKVNGDIRKKEYIVGTLECDNILKIISHEYDIPMDNILSVSESSDGKYGVYYSSKPAIGVFDLDLYRHSGLMCEPVYGLKIDTSQDIDNAFKGKVYYMGDVASIGVKYNNVIATGIYTDYSAITVYFADKPVAVSLTDLSKHEYNAVTLYSDGTKSEVSVYMPS